MFPFIAAQVALALIQATVINCKMMYSATSFGNNYYLNDEALDLFSANDSCTKLGGSLVKIESELENDFLDKVIAGEFGGKLKYWIGAVRHSNSDTFQWLDGTSINFTNMGQSRTVSSRAKCAGITTISRDGGWIDAPCEELFPSVCEVKEALDDPVEPVLRAKEVLKNSTAGDGGRWKIFSDEIAEVLPPSQGKDVKKKCRELLGREKATNSGNFTEISEQINGNIAKVTEKLNGTNENVIALRETFNGKLTSLEDKLSEILSRQVSIEDSIRDVLANLTMGIASKN